MTHEVISHADAKARGLTRFFTGEPCKHGHLSERQTSNRSCVTCQNEAKRKWERGNKERHAAGCARRNRRWGEKNAERKKETCRRWRAKHPEKSRAHVLNRRAMRAEATPPDFGEFDQFVIEEAALTCKRREAMHGEPFHVDHIVPLSRGGLHCATNLQVIPARLNVMKFDKLIFQRPGEWIHDA